MGRIYSLSAHNDNTSGDVTGITKTRCRIKIHEYKQRQQADVRSWAISKTAALQTGLHNDTKLLSCTVLGYLFFFFFFLLRQKEIVPQSNNLNKKKKVKKKKRKEKSWQTNVLHRENVHKREKKKRKRCQTNETLVSRCILTTVWIKALLSDRFTGARLECPEWVLFW